MWVALIVLLILSGCAHFKAEPLADAGQSGVNQIRLTFPVKLNPDNRANRKVVGVLSYSGSLEGKVLQVLLSGGGYGPVYFDFPFQPDTYSYVRSAVRAGYATLNLSRIGVGKSSRPLGSKVDVDANAYVVHQAITMLRDELVTGARPGPIVTVGHSMGSVMAIAHAVAYPDDIDGLILTGILHTTNPEYTERVRDSSKLAILDRRFVFRIWDFTYFTSKRGMREEMFYYGPSTDPDVIEIDEATRETLTLGEIISVSRFDRTRTREIKVPVLLVNGDRDFTSCGGDIDCQETQRVIDFENQFFSKSAELEVFLPKDTGHVINLHTTAPKTYKFISDWILKRVHTQATSQ